MINFIGIENCLLCIGEFQMKYKGINIRQAQFDDIKAIAEIKVRGWQTAYSEIVDKEYLNKMTVFDHTRQIKESYALENMFVAEKDNEILGFCRVCSYDEAFNNVDCEIREIYVKPDMKRMGIGSKLFSYITDFFKQKNKLKMYLCCFKENYASRKFYESMGGICGDEQEMEIGEKLYKLASYTYDLSV